MTDPRMHSNRPKSGVRALALVATSIAALAWGGCAGGAPMAPGSLPTSTGMLPAHWSPPEGSVEAVPFTFDGAGTSTGSLFTTLGSGGEHFRGSYVLLTHSTKGHLVSEVYDGWSAPEWNIWKKEPDGHWTATATSYGEFGHFYTGKVVAYLPGNEGHAMRCRITLNQPQGGFLQGGTGECQVSDGGSVALDF